MNKKKKIEKLTKEILWMDKIRNMTFSGKLWVKYTNDIAYMQKELTELGGVNPLAEK